MTLKSSRIIPGLLESDSRNMDIKQEVGDPDSCIHSGHFMLSRVHDPNLDEDDEDSSSLAAIDQPAPYDFTASKKEPAESYEFKEQPSTTIETSLSKLFDCLSLAYRYINISDMQWTYKPNLYLSFHKLHSGCYVVHL